VLSDLRNRMIPRHLENFLYLRVNRHLWNEGTIRPSDHGPSPTCPRGGGEVCIFVFFLKRVEEMQEEVN
jgi:hypothetical protein